MEGFLDTYGVTDEKRERRVKRIVLWGLAIVVVGTGIFFTFRTWGQERAMDRFVTLLQHQDYQGAYKLWNANKYYPPERFVEDWGPAGTYKEISAVKIEHVDACGTGVVFSLTFPKADAVGLWVDRETNLISFAPWPRCPGRHWQFKEFFKQYFS